MEDKKQIIIFGGCFNPPLNSHFSLADQLLNEYQIIEKIVFMPVGDFYQNTEFYNKDTICNAEDRYNMLKIECDKNEKFDVSRLEIDAEKQLCTYETLQKMSELYPENQICFLMGSDNLKEIEKWNSAEELLSKYKVYLLARDKDDINQIINESTFLSRHRENLIIANDNIIVNISSTFVRRKIKEGKSVRYIVSDDVYDYIKDHNLYKG